MGAEEPADWLADQQQTSVGPVLIGSWSGPQSRAWTSRTDYTLLNYHQELLPRPKWRQLMNEYGNTRDMEPSSAYHLDLPPSLRVPPAWLTHDLSEQNHDWDQHRRANKHIVQQDTGACCYGMNWSFGAGSEGFNPGMHCTQPLNPDM